MQVCKYASMQVLRFANMQIWHYALKCSFCFCCSCPKSVDKHQVEPIPLQPRANPGVFSPSSPPCTDSLVQVTPHPANHSSWSNPG